MTCLDIAYAVQVVSQSVRNPHKNHLTAIHCFRHYIRGSTQNGLFYSSSSPLCLQGYVDVDWASCPDTRRSTTGWCMFLGTYAILSKSKKQSANQQMRLSTRLCHLL